jgi:uncharacterized protein YPO0396
MDNEFVPYAGEMIAKAEANWPAIKERLAQEGFQ